MLTIQKQEMLRWTPRVLAIIIICFLAIFALDVFIPGKTIGYYSGALFMHLLPNFLLGFLLVISWKYEKIGGALFLISGIYFTYVFKTYLSLINFMIISFPIFLIGALFLVHDFYGKEGSE